MSQDTYQVWAIQYETHCTRTGARDTRTVAVSAESEYGAVKRLVGNRHCAILRLALTDLEPEYKQRRIEGFERVQDWVWDYHDAKRHADEANRVYHARAALEDFKAGA